MALPTPDARPVRRPDRRPDRRGAAAVTLVVLGLLLWLAYRLTVGSEAHAFVAGATPPASVELTAGETYGISVPGGVDRGDLPARLRCSLTPVDGEPTTLNIARASDDTRALNEIATFTAPNGGRATVACSGLSAVFVDDADDTGTDRSGLFLVLACIALAIGLPLLLSTLRTSSSGSRSASPHSPPQPQPTPPNETVPSTT